MSSFEYTLPQELGSQQLTTTTNPSVEGRGLTPLVSSCTHNHKTCKHLFEYNFKWFTKGLEGLPISSWQFSSPHSLLVHIASPEGQFVLFYSIEKPSYDECRRPSGGQCGPVITLTFEV